MMDEQAKKDLENSGYKLTMTTTHTRDLIMLIGLSLQIDVTVTVLAACMFVRSSSIRHLQPLRVLAASLWRFRDHKQGRTSR